MSDPLFRFKPWKQQRHGSISRGVKMTFFGLKLGVAHHPVFNRCWNGGAERKVIMVGVRLRRFNVGLLYQRYRPGYELHKHIDGPQDNHILWLLLRRSKAGGELEIEGDHRSFLGGRVKTFNGGRQIHGFTRVEGSDRVVLMLQVAPRCTTGTAVD
jgi:hypothetical protein